MVGAPEPGGGKTTTSLGGVLALFAVLTCGCVSGRASRMAVAMDCPDESITQDGQSTSQDEAAARENVAKAFLFFLRLPSSRGAPVRTFSGCGRTFRCKERWGPLGLWRESGCTGGERAQAVCS